VCCAVLCCAVLCCAVLCCAVLCCAAARLGPCQSRGVLIIIIGSHASIAYYCRREGMSAATSEWVTHTLTSWWLAPQHLWPWMTHC
jgi:hypothetical protein